MLKESVTADGGFSLDGYRALLRSEGQLARLMAHSLALSLLTASVSTLVGVRARRLARQNRPPVARLTDALVYRPAPSSSLCLGRGLVFHPGSDRIAWRRVAGFVVAKNLLGIFWATRLCVRPCDGVHADRHAFDDRLSTNSESAAGVCGKAGQRVAKHPAPNNAAAHDAGNLFRRRAHISPVDRRDQRSDVSAFPGLSCRDVDAVRCFLRFSRGERLPRAPLFLLTLVILGLQTGLHKRVLQLGRRTPSDEMALIALGRWRGPALALLLALAIVLVVLPTRRSRRSIAFV